MKRFLLIPSCAVLALSMLTSCQKEEKSALELAQELTAELQKVTDHRTAEAAAPRVQVLNQRLQDASVRTVTLNSNALLRSDQQDAGAAYADALVKLAREVGRVRSSVPVTTHDGEVDRDRLVMATGVASGTDIMADASARMAAGQKFMKHDADKSHEGPPTFEECYGSAKLKEALAYTADPANAPIMKFDGEGDVPAIPEPVAVEAEEAPSAAETPAADGDEPADDTAASTDDTVEPAASDDDDPAATDDDDSDGDISISLDGDEPSTSDDTDEPAADDSDDSSSDDAGGDELDFDISI